MLIKCPECNREISDQAISCPHCGYPLKKKTNKKVEEAPKEEVGIIKVAQRGGARGYHTFIYIATAFVLVIGLGLSIEALIFFIMGWSIGGAIALILIGETLTGIATAAIIYLSVLLGKNRRIKHDLIYFDKSTDEFIFYSINDKEIRLKKNTSFFVTNNMKNVGELIMKENGKKKVMLGFSLDPIETIVAEVKKYQD